jgi:CheY-like chemotaxis protein
VSDTDRVGPRLLIVDDDEIILKAVSRLLGAFGYHVVTALGGEAALATLSVDRAFDLVIFDYEMPALDGSEFFRLATARHPELRGRFVLATGNAESSGARALVSEGLRAVLGKPYSSAEVARLFNAR